MFQCPRCGGTGQTVWTHIENGICFQCGGTGEISYQPKKKAEADPHPELLVPEGERSTTRQWEYFAALCPSDKLACEIMHKAGAPMATQRYVTKAVMSKAITLAKELKA